MIFTIVLTEGMNRQIRRMCEYLGYEVKKLVRVRIMNVSLELPVGEWRELTDQEMTEINSLVSTSSKTYDDPAQARRPGRPNVGPSGRPKRDAPRSTRNKRRP